MGDITKHDSKQKWESDNGEYSRVDFFIARSSISIYYHLERRQELI